MAALQSRDPTLTAAVAMIYDKEQNKNYCSPVVKRLQVTAASYLYPICLVHRAHYKSRLQMPALRRVRGKKHVYENT